MPMSRDELDKLVSIYESITGRKCFLLDPNSMTEAEIKEQEQRAIEHQRKVELGDLICSNCNSEIELGNSLCLKCGHVQ